MHLFKNNNKRLEFVMKEVYNSLEDFIDQYHLREPDFSSGHTQTHEIYRMAVSLSLTRPAKAPGDHIVDLGGTAIWIPLYQKFSDISRSQLCAGMQHNTFQSIISPLFRTPQLMR